MFLRKRSCTGSQLLELPIAIWLAVLALFLPLLDLSLLGLRVGTLHMAARNGAREAGRAASYTEAAELAKSKVIQSLNAGLGGNTITRITTTIVATPIDGGEPSRSTAPIATDPDNFVYQMEVSVQATAAPLLEIDCFGDIPGLSGPFPVTVACTEMAEHPKGLSK
jgi:hypothetical protein